jgi:hypothetical protein
MKKSVSKDTSIVSGILICYLKQPSKKYFNKPVSFYMNLLIRPWLYQIFYLINTTLLFQSTFMAFKYDTISKYNYTDNVFEIELHIHLISLSNDQEV